MLNNTAITQTTNIVPVQGIFTPDPNFALVNLIGPAGRPFYPNINPVQSGLTIVNSTINSSVIGGVSPSTATFTNLVTTTGQVNTSPVNSLDLANKAYVDATSQGLSFKQPANVTTIANITLSGLQTIDGYTTLAGDRVLVRSQTAQADNGIYVAAAGAWSRSADANTYAELLAAYLFVLQGTVWGGSSWVCTNIPGGTLGVTAITFVQFSNNAIYTVGTGLNLIGFQFSIANTPVTAGTFGSASKSLTAAVNAQGQLTSLTAQDIAIANTQVSGLGTMSTQNANSVAITGGSITGTPISGSTVGGSTITASTQFSGPGTGLTGTATTLNIGGNAATATSATTAGSATTATTATNLAGGAAGSIPYQSGAGITAFLASGSGVLVGGATPTFSTAPTLTGTNFSAIPNSALTNSSFTLGSTSIALGGTATVISGLTLSGAKINNSAPYLDYAPSAQPSYLEGRSWYDSTTHSLAYYNEVTNNTVYTGQQVQLRVINNTGSSIAAGMVVYITSTSSGQIYPNIALAQANNVVTSALAGLTSQSIANGAIGYVTTVGIVANVNTGLFTVGDTLYLSPYSAGFMMNTVPPTGYAVKVGTVAYVNSTTGQIFVRQSNAYVLAPNISGVVAIANGGTNGTAAPTAGAIAYGSGTAYAFSAAGTTGQVLTSAGAGTPTWTTPIAYATVTDDTTTAATRYPLFAASTSGNLTTEYTSSTKYQYNPSTGILTATGFAGAGTGLTGTATSLSIGGNAATATSATSATTATNLAGGAASQIPYQTAAGATGFIGNGTSGQILQSNGASVPTWVTFTGGATIVDDTTTNATRYPLFAAATSGTLSTSYTSSTKYQYNPNTGALAAPVVQATNGLFVNSNTVSVSYSIPSGSNAVSAGPITVNSGITVTTPSGSRWVVV